MPYPFGHREEIRKKIIQSARRSFNRYGFDGASLSQIMAGVGLTHGVFYNYFKSKSDLYAEVVSCFFTDPNWKNAWKGVHVDLQSANAGEQVIRAYLSRQHYAQVENSCPMTALPGDVARSGKSAKRAFERVFRAMVGVLEHGQVRLRRSSHLSERNSAQAIAALCVGGMVVARALMSRAFADELREACMKVALYLGDWSNRGRAKASGRGRASTVRTRRAPH